MVAEYEEIALLNLEAEFASILESYDEPAATLGLVVVILNNGLTEDLRQT